MQAIPCTHSDEHESLLTIVDAIEHDHAGLVSIVARRARYRSSDQDVVKETEQIIAALLDEYDSRDESSIPLVHPTVGLAYNDGVVADYEDDGIRSSPRFYSNLPSVDAAFFGEVCSWPGFSQPKRTEQSSKDFCANPSLINKEHIIDAVVKTKKRISYAASCVNQRSVSHELDWKINNPFELKYSILHGWKPKSLQEALEPLSHGTDSWLDMLSFKGQGASVQLAITLNDKACLVMDMVEFSGGDYAFSTQSARWLNVDFANTYEYFHKTHGIDDARAHHSLCRAIKMLDPIFISKDDAQEIEANHVKIKLHNKPAASRYTIIEKEI